jgi:DNA-binding MarR family transcriptional regulator
MLRIVKTSTPTLASHLRVAVARLARHLRHQGAHEDATPSQLAALATLYHQAPITLGELAQIERVKPPTMTRIVAGLEEKGLVRREHSSADGRLILVAITDDGRTYHEQYQQRRDAWLARQLADLTKDERETLSKAAAIFDRLVEAG